MGAVAAHRGKVLRFALVSGLGLAIDFALFLGLVALSFSPLIANAVSGTCAVTFVYFASVRRIFSYAGSFLVGLFLAYVAYQVVGVSAASLAVWFLAAEFVSPAVAKILILPLTFSANYLFMSLLTRKAGAPRRADIDTAAHVQSDFAAANDRLPPHVQPHHEEKLL